MDKMKRRIKRAIISGEKKHRIVINEKKGTYGVNGNEYINFRFDKLNRIYFE